MVLDSNKYEGEVNHIGIPHGRTMAPGEILTENEQAASMFGIRKVNVDCSDCATGRDLRCFGIIAYISDR